MVSVLLICAECVIIISASTGRTAAAIESTKPHGNVIPGLIYRIAKGRQKYIR